MRIRRRHVEKAGMSLLPLLLLPSLNIKSKVRMSANACHSVEKRVTGA